jgi:two-component system, response regulator PdtaR
MYGEDKKTLSVIKNYLTSEGNSFAGYSCRMTRIIEQTKKYLPELVIIKLSGNFDEVEYTLSSLDNELLTLSLIILDTKNKKIINFIEESKSLIYIIKPIDKSQFFNILEIAQLNFCRTVKYEEKISELSSTLESRKTIEQAKWLLVEKQGYSEPDAHSLIRKKSRDNRMSMVEIANSIILSYN